MLIFTQITRRARSQKAISSRFRRIADGEERPFLLSKTLQREPSPLRDTGAVTERLSIKAKLRGESGCLGLPAYGAAGFVLF